MDQILGQILRQAMWERLDMLDELASQADAESLVSVARTEMPRLANGWRALLAAHEPDTRGRCPECSRRWRPRQAPCSVWGAAHATLVAEALPTPPRPSAPSGPRAGCQPARGAELRRQLRCDDNSTDWRPRHFRPGLPHPRTPPPGSDTSPATWPVIH